MNAQMTYYIYIYIDLFSRRLYSKRPTNKGPLNIYLELSQ